MGRSFGLGRRFAAGLAALAGVVADGASNAPVQARGAAVFAERCRSCHDPATARAPGLADLMVLSADQIEETLLTGSMSGMAFGLRREEIEAVARYLSAGGRGGREADVSPPAIPRRSP